MVVWSTIPTTRVKLTGNGDGVAGTDLCDVRFAKSRFEYPQG